MKIWDAHLAHLYFDLYILYSDIFRANTFRRRGQDLRETYTHIKNQKQLSYSDENAYYYVGRNEALKIHRNHISFRPVCNQGH